MDFLGCLKLKYFETWWMPVTQHNTQRSSPICLNIEKIVKGYQYGYQMKAIDVGVKNIQFVYRFWCLFPFYEYKQINVNNSQLAEFATKPHAYGYQMKVHSLKIKNMMSFNLLCCFVNINKQNLNDGFSRLSEVQMFQNLVEMPLT